MKYKHYCWFVLAAVAALVLYNGLLWHFSTQHIFTRKDGLYSGDLARIGYLFSHAHPRRNINDLPRRHLNFADYHGQSVDVITIGDSFSNGGGHGPNRYFQDHLSSIQDLTVLNLSPHLPGAQNIVESAAMLANGGLLDNIQPRYLILEVVERNVHQFAKPVDFTKFLDLAQIQAANHRNEVYVDDLPPTGWLNTAHIKWPVYSLLYWLSPYAYSSRVYKHHLMNEMFSGPHGSDLLFYSRDLKKFNTRKRAIDLALAEKINQNLNTLAKLLRSKNIDLIFMPAPDKLTLYGPYISGASYPESRFFDLFRALPKDYRWIDTKEILGKELAKGTKDLYWIDDTHWSWKASKSIFEKFDLQQ